MAKQSINIERLEIRLKGVSAQTARAAVRDLGHELLGQLAAPQNLTGGKRVGKIDQVDAGNAQLAAGTASSELRGEIAGKIAAAIKAKQGNGSV